MSQHLQTPAPEAYTAITNTIEKVVSPQTYAKRRAREKAEQHETNVALFKGFLVLAVILFIVAMIIRSMNPFLFY